MSTPEHVTSRPPVSAERLVTRAFEDAGAISPATARALAEVPGVTSDAAVALVARRVIRESAPGRYYLYDGTEHARRRRWVIALLVLFLLLLPPFLLQVTRR